MEFFRSTRRVKLSQTIIFDFRALKLTFPGIQFYVVLSGFLFSFLGAFIFGIFGKLISSYIGPDGLLLALILLSSGAGQGIVLYFLSGKVTHVIWSVKAFTPFWLCSLSISYSSSCLAMMTIGGPVPNVIYAFGKPLSSLFLAIVLLVSLTAVILQFKYVDKSLGSLASRQSASGSGCVT